MILRARVIPAFLAAVCAAVLMAAGAGGLAAPPSPEAAAPPPIGAGQSNMANLTNAANPATAARPANPALIQAVRSADAAGDDLKVIELVQQWLQSRPTGEEAAEAFYLIGKASWRQQQADDAVFYLKKLLADAPHSPRAADASAALGQIYATKGSKAEAIAYLEKAASLNPAPDFSRPIDDQLVGLYRQAGQLLKAVDTLMALRRLAEADADAGAVTAVDGRVADLIDHETDAERLQRLVASYARRFPADLALLRLADLAAQQHEPYDEEQWLKRLLAEFPKHPNSAQIADRLRADLDVVRGKSSVIGVLLPLSGPARAFGRSALRGAQVAWEAVPAQERTPLGLIIRDSQAADGLQAEALERWAKEFRPLAVVGPLLGREMEQVRTVARRLELPFISPGALIGSAGGPPVTAPVPPSVLPNGAAQESAGEADSYLFWNGLTLAQQARSIADYAVTRLGAKRFMVLYPNEPYARAAAEVFADTVRAQQGEVIAAIDYPPDSTDYGPQIRAMKTADLSRYGAIGPPTEGKPPDDWPYTPGFDAIFLPGDAGTGGLLAAQLAFYGFEQTMLLGVGSWNRQELLTYGGRFVEGAVMADGFFARSSSPVVQEFVRRYQMRYHEEPDVFAAQAYDAMRMALSAIQQGARNGKQVRDYLSGIRLYPGVSGPTTLAPGLPAQKQAVIVKVQGGKLVQVN